MNRLENAVTQKRMIYTDILPDYFILNDIYGDRVLEHVSDQARALENIWIFIDHVVPSDSVETDEKQVKLRNFARKYPVHFQEAAGIAYQLLAENHLVPGQVVAGAGRHISSCGALGYIPVLLGEEELAKAIMEGKIEREDRPCFHIRLKGSFSWGGDYWSLAMKILEKKLPDRGLLVISVDPENTDFPMHDRLLFCAALSQNGFVPSVILPDDTLYDYLEERGRAVERKVYEAEYDCVMDLSEIRPCVLEPEAVRAVPCDEIETTKVTSVFIGGCMGGSYSDIRKTAEFMKGRQASKNMRVLVVPNTQEVYLKAVNEGYVDILEDAGIMLMNPHCSACWGKAQGHIMDDETAVTTGYRNCRGCLGAEKGRVYVVPLNTALECIVTGKLEGKHE